MLEEEYSVCFIFYLPTELHCLYKVEKHFSITLDSVSEPSQINVKVLTVRMFPG